eukprot:1149971-Pelagomonas_calceolata.AAC.2
MVGMLRAGTKTRASPYPPRPTSHTLRWMWSTDTSGGAQWLACCKLAQKNMPPLTTPLHLTHLTMDVIHGCTRSCAMVGLLRASLARLLVMKSAAPADIHSGITGDPLTMDFIVSSLLLYG